MHPDGVPGAPRPPIGRRAAEPVNRAGAPVRSTGWRQRHRRLTPRAGAGSAVREYGPPAGVARPPGGPAPGPPGSRAPAGAGIGCSDGRPCGRTVAGAPGLARCDAPGAHLPPRHFGRERRAASGARPRRPGRGVGRPARRVVIAAAIDGSATFGDGGAVEIAPAGDTRARPIVQATLDAATTERTLLLAEIYRRGGSWRFRAVGQGFDHGLDELARGYGVDVEG
ncbi:TerD family protein [Kitasatospora sp. RG8]|nr:TerD family protein [Kitasatospora sp. RG8]